MDSSGLTCRDAAAAQRWIERELRIEKHWRRDIDVARILYEAFLNCRTLAWALDIEALLMYRVIMFYMRSYCFYRVADTPSAALHLERVIDRLREDESLFLKLHDKLVLEKDPRVRAVFPPHIAEYPEFIESLEEILKTAGSLEPRAQ